MTEASNTMIPARKPNFMGIKPPKTSFFDLKLSERLQALWVMLMPLIVWLPTGWFEGYQALTVLLFLVVSFRYRSWSWLRQPWFVAMFALWVFWVVRSLALPDISLSLGVALPWLRFPLFAAACMWLYRQSPDHLYRFIWATGICCALVAFDTISQYHFGQDWLGIIKPEAYRLTGPLHKMRVGAILSAMMLPLVAMAAACATQHGWRHKRVWAWLAVVAICGLAILLSGERTACLRIACSVLLLIALAAPIRRALCLITLGAVLLTAGLLVTHADLVKRHIGLSTHQYSTPIDNPYRQNWVNAYQLWLQDPIWGIGPKQYRVACLSLPASEGLSEPYCKKHPHGWLVQYVTEGGLIGLGLLLTMLYGAYRNTWRRRHRQAATSIWSLTGLASTVVYFGPLPMSSFFAVWVAMPWFFFLSWAIQSPIHDPRRRRRYRRARGDRAQASASPSSMGADEKA